MIVDFYTYFAGLSLKWAFIFLFLMGFQGCDVKAPLKKDIKASSFYIAVQDMKTPLNIPVWAVKNMDLPVVSMALSFKGAGSKADPASQKGLAQLIYRMLDEGAGPLSGQKFKEYLLSHNIQFSAHVSDDDFFLFFRTTKDNLQKALYAMKLILTQPHFSEQPLGIAKSQIISALKQASEDEDEMAYELVKKKIFDPNHPYATLTETVIQNIPLITSDDLKQFVKDHFTLDKLSVVIVGNFDDKDFVTSLNDELGGLPTSSRGQNEYAYLYPKMGHRIYFRSLDVPQTKILFLHPSVSRKDKDFYPLYLASKVLVSNSMYSHLWQEVREKRGLVYDISGDLFWQDHTHYFSGECATEGKNVDEVIRIVRDEYQKIVKNGITEEELTFIKKQLIDAFPANFSDTIKLSRSLSRYQSQGFGVDYVNKRNDLIAAVTLEQANQCIRKYLNPNRLTFFVVGRKEPKMMEVNTKNPQNNPATSQQG